MNIKGVKGSAIVLYGQFDALKDICDGYHTIICHNHLLILSPFDVECVFNRAQNGVHFTLIGIQLAQLALRLNEGSPYRQLIGDNVDY